MSTGDNSNNNLYTWTSFNVFVVKANTSVYATNWIKLKIDKLKIT